MEAEMGRTLVIAALVLSVLTIPAQADVYVPTSTQHLVAACESKTKEGITYCDVYLTIILDAYLARRPSCAPPDMADFVKTILVLVVSEAKRQPQSNAAGVIMGVLSKTLQCNDSSAQFDPLLSTAGLASKLWAIPGSTAIKSKLWWNL